MNAGCDISRLDTCPLGYPPPRTDSPTCKAKAKAWGIKH